MKKRQNIYQFLRYAAEHDIPVVLPHPLYFYTSNENIDLVLFEKLAVMFQRFEVLNGQRDLWQSTLTLNWAQGLTPEKIQAYAKKHNLDPRDFNVDPDRPKYLSVVLMTTWVYLPASAAHTLWCPTCSSA